MNGASSVGNLLNNGLFSNTSLLAQCLSRESRSTISLEVISFIVVVGFLTAILHPDLLAILEAVVGW